MNSRFAFLLKKSFQVGWILSAPSVRSDVNYGFGESAGCVLQGHTSKMMLHHKRSEKWSFKKTSIWNNLRNNVQSAHCRFATLLK